ncbi:MAG: peptide deformylase [Bacteroidota bacterium]
MILPIVAYGDPVLKKKAVNIDEKYPDLQQLIDDMFETMDNASGVGLAAPQIGKSIRLFIVDATPFEDKEPEVKDFVQVFINPVIVEESGEEWGFNEGCLSIPGIREDVFRKPTILVRYYDENFEYYEEEFSGIAARIIQHEYDHIEGKLFVERINPLKKALIKGKLNDISKGNVDCDYKMRFAKK